MRAMLLPLILGLSFSFTPASAWKAGPVEKLADGFAFTEGPAADAKGNVLFTDQPNDRILCWSIDNQLSTWLQPCGRANGLYFDATGALWACADEKNALWKISPEKQITVVLAAFESRRLNGPNDLWIHPEGGVYFTDPFYKRPYWKHEAQEQPCQGVYYLAPDHSSVRRIAGDLSKPNGIIGDARKKLLYVADIGAGCIFRYRLGNAGSLEDKTRFCEPGSDGMTLDAKGNLYLTGKGVYVFNPAGEKIGHIPIPEAWTANVCFGGPSRNMLFITASKGLYRVKIDLD